MNDYREKYLKYKRKYLYLKKKQLGGDVTTQELIDNGISNAFHPYVYLFRNWVIPNITINGTRCNGNVADMNMVAHGGNGFVLSFKCANNFKYTVKFNFENVQPWEGFVPDRLYISGHVQPTIDEYLNIKQFDSPFIMKAYYFFEFKPREKKFIIKENPSTQVVNSEIVLCEDYTHNPDYKYNPTENPETSVIPRFTGIILEYIQNSFEQLPTTLPYNKIQNLFKQYTQGLKVINDRGFIHKDIKANNLRYNLSGENYAAKIIDMGTLYTLPRTKDFTSATQEISSEKLVKLLQANTPADTPEKMAIYNQIVNKFDLYSLAFTFKNHGFVNLTRDTQLYKIINKCLCNLYTNDEVIALL
jgi:serine/threonine protein kinase